MKNPLARVIHQVAKGAAPTAAVASGLLSPVALGASGDVDPAYGDVGRVSSPLDFAGPIWSLEPVENDEGIIGGGREVCIDYCDYFEFYDEGFVGQLSDTGASTWNAGATFLRDTQVFDVARQTDGKLVGVGRTVTGHRRRSQHDVSLTVFRLEPNGNLDSTFGNGGVVQLSSAQGANSVALDPTGRIVVAGSQDGKLIVLRLLTNGSPDSTFGAGGIFLGPSFGSRIFPDPATDSGTHILRTAGGGYRISMNVGWMDCQVVALTANGTLDPGFGSSGVASLHAASGLRCNSMVAQANDRLLLAGQRGERAFIIRLLASGKQDGSFTDGAAENTMQEATALAVDAYGAVLVAGRPPEGVPAEFPPSGVPGVLIMRLQADGGLDGLFGSGGSTLVDLQSEDLTTPVIHDMSVLADGRILAAGGDSSWPAGARPFVVRLLGDAGGDGPGVLGVVQPSVAVNEQAQQAIVTVRRMGGTAGEVSVRYQAAPSPDPEWSDLAPATLGQDFLQATGRLSWGNGDTADKKVIVRLVGNDGAQESSERFLVTLDDVQGGAGLGTSTTGVVIRGDIAPAGRFQIYSFQSPISESAGSVEVSVARDFYSAGAASVTLTPIAETAAAGTDFAPEPITVSWGDGESETKIVRIGIINDGIHEPTETFTVALSNPSAGAFLGPHSAATIAITSDEAAAAIVALRDRAVTIGEASGSILLNVARSGDPSAAVSVDYSTSPVSASAGSDFSNANGTLTWAAADLADKTISVNIDNDGTDEDDEIFTVTLSNPAGGMVLGPNTTATVTITDDDPPAAVGDGDGDGNGGGDGGGGGGGAFDWLALLVLTCFGLGSRLRERLI